MDEKKKDVKIFDLPKLKDILERIWHRLRQTAFCVRL